MRVCTVQKEQAGPQFVDGVKVEDTHDLGLVVATRNLEGRESYIANSLKSLSNGRLRYRVVFVDDASTDNTQKILESLRALPVSIVINRLPDQRGPGAARNLGLALLQGCEFVTFVDDDDSIHVDGLEEVLQGMRSKGSNVGAGSYEVVADGADGKFRDSTRPCSSQLLPPLQREVALWRLVFRVSMLHESGTLFPNWRYGEDITFLNRLGSHVWRIDCYQRLTYTYRRRPDSTSRKDPPSAKEVRRVLFALWSPVNLIPGCTISRLAWSGRISARLARIGLGHVAAVMKSCAFCGSGTG